MVFNLKRSQSYRPQGVFSMGLLTQIHTNRKNTHNTVARTKHTITVREEKITEREGGKGREGKGHRGKGEIEGRTRAQSVAKMCRHKPCDAEGCSPSALSCLRVTCKLVPQRTAVASALQVFTPSRCLGFFFVSASHTFALPSTSRPPSILPAEQSS